MRIKLRNSLNIDAPVNLRRLTPAMKVYAGIMSKIHSSKMYKQEINRKVEANAIKKMQQDEILKEMLLSKIYKELNSNATLKPEGKVCSSMVISVEASQKHSLDRVLKQSEFLPYKIEFIEENRDIRLAFKNMPYLIRVSKKII